MEVRFFTNNRGNKQLIDPQNHVYFHNKTKPSGKSFWRCANYKTCNASAILQDEQVFVRIPEHDHGSDLAGLQAKLQALDAIEKARQNPNIRPRQILGELAAQPGGPETKLASPRPFKGSGQRRVTNQIPQSHSLICLMVRFPTSI